MTSPTQKTQWIETTNDLITFIDKVKGSPFLAIDSEFVREKTYYPILCLLQVADENHAAVIDALAEGIDLSPLYELLKDKNIVKVFHAARQDLEILYHAIGEIPSPVFDTQVAASFCGFGESISYDNLVGILLSTTLDKTSRFTDWSLRPLSQTQIKYALNDVLYLTSLYKKLQEKLGERTEWAKEEMVDLENKDLYDIDSETAWKKVKLRGIKPPKDLIKVKLLAGWREEEAKKRDLPRGHVLKDEGLIEIATHPLKELKDFKRLRFVSSGNVERYGKLFLELLEKAKQIPKEEWPTLPKKKKPTQIESNRTDFLKLLLNMKATAHNVTARSIASSKELDDIARDLEKASVKVFNGWRYDIFGKDALEILKEKKALRLEKGKLKLFEL